LRVHLGRGFEACDEISYVAVCDHISKVLAVSLQREEIAQ